MNKKNIFMAGLFLVCGFLFFLACEGDQENPVAPPTPTENPATLKLTYNVTGATINSNNPLIIHVYQNKNNITNQKDPVYVHLTDRSNDSYNIDNIPPGTYYILVWRHSQNPLETLQTCERFVIWTTNYWIQPQEVKATAVNVSAGAVINVDIDKNIDDDFYDWGPCW